MKTFYFEVESADGTYVHKFRGENYDDAVYWLYLYCGYEVEILNTWEK